jgi:hypothetical protein
MALEIHPSWSKPASGMPASCDRNFVTEIAGAGAGTGALAGDRSVTKSRRKAGRPRGRIQTGAVSCRLPASVVVALQAEARAAGRSPAAVLAEAVRLGRPDWWAQIPNPSPEAEVVHGA